MELILWFWKAHAHSTVHYIVRNEAWINSCQNVQYVRSYRPTLSTQDYTVFSFTKSYAYAVIM